ncbi:MAG TPA: methyltransferase [Conexibacter sp.]|nr:methyltransferase [Conexibacter sp.]
MSRSHDASIAQGLPHEIPAYRIDAYVPERQVDEMYGVGDLARLMRRKVLRRLLPQRSASAEQVAANYAGLIVFDRREQHWAGLAYGRDFPRVLNELGIGRCRRLFEFCAGPGYIGYGLFANGWCETLALSDVDADAIATAMRTARYNGIEHRVTGYASDVLDDIPEHERWDVVVANPPAFESHPDKPLADGEWDRGFDTGWNVRRRFYASVKAHMNPGGVVVMSENLRGSDPDVFAEMIRAGGGEPRAVHIGTDVQGRANGAYFQLSIW